MMLYTRLTVHARLSALMSTSHLTHGLFSDSWPSESSSCRSALEPGPAGISLISISMTPGACSSVMGM